MSVYNLDSFKIAKVNEDGATYYYYLYLQPKAHALSDNTRYYILRTNVAGTDFKYSFGVNFVDAIWTAKATQVYKDINCW